MAKFIRFSEMRRDILHLFSWGRGPRGGEYYVPKGKPDIAKNRLYGQRAQAAAKADGETKPSEGTQAPTPPAAQPTEPNGSATQARPTAEPNAKAAIRDYYVGPEEEFGVSQLENGTWVSPYHSAARSGDLTKRSAMATARKEWQQIAGPKAEESRRKDLVRLNHTRKMAGMPPLIYHPGEALHIAEMAVKQGKPIPPGILLEKPELAEKYKSYRPDSQTAAAPAAAKPASKQQDFQNLVKSYDGTGVFFPADETVKEVEVPTAIRKTSQTVLMLKGQDKYEAETVNGTLYAIPGVPDRPVFMTNIRGYYKVYDAKTGVQITFAALKGTPAYKKQLQDRLLWTAVLSLKGDREKFDRSVDGIAEVIQRNGMPKKSAPTKPTGPTVSMTPERNAVAEIAKRFSPRFGLGPDAHLLLLRSLEDPAARKMLMDAAQRIPKRDWNNYAIRAMDELQRVGQQLPAPKETPNPTMLSGEPDPRMVEFQELVRRSHPGAVFLDPAKRMPSVEKVTKVARQKLSLPGPDGQLATGTYDIYAIPGLPDVPFAISTKRKGTGGYSIIDPFTGYYAGEYEHTFISPDRDLLNIGFMALKNIDAIRNGPLERARKQYGS